MRNTFFLVLAFFAVSTVGAQQSGKVKDIEYRRAYRFSGEIKGGTDSVFVEGIELVFPEEVEITGISFDGEKYAEELLSPEAQSPENGKSKGRKLFIGEGSPFYGRSKSGGDMYLVDKEKQLYRVKLDRPASSPGIREDRGADPKMIYRRTRPNQIKAQP